MKKETLEIEKQETIYSAMKMNQSDYDHLIITQDRSGLIKIEFNDQRWRKVKETQELLREMADKLELLNNFKPSSQNQDEK